jgi:hypothetical protein
LITYQKEHKPFFLSRAQLLQLQPTSNYSSSTANMSDEQIILPIIDSHIHLYPASEVDSLSWYTPENPLAGQHSLEEYREASSSAPSLLGFVFVETDRKNDVEAGAADGSGWEGPLAEVSWLKRIALGRARARDTQPRTQSCVWVSYLGRLSSVVLRCWSAILIVLRRKLVMLGQRSRVSAIYSRTSLTALCWTRSSSRV